MEEQKTTFLGSQKTGSEVNPGNIFQELQEELATEESLGEGVAEKKHPIVIASKVSSALFVLAFVSTIVMSLDSGIRNYVQSGLE